MAVTYTPTPNAKDRLRRLFTLLVEHAIVRPSSPQLGERPCDDLEESDSVCADCRRFSILLTLGRDCSYGVDLHRSGQRIVD